MRWMLRIALVAACMAAAVCSYAQDDVTPIIGYVLAEPRIAEMSDGTFCVNYEIIVANVTKSAYTIEEIRVVDPAKPDAPLLKLNADEIAKYDYMPGSGEPTFRILPGQSGYIKINLTFNSGKAVPKEIEHIITASADTPVPMVPQPAVERIARAAISPGPSPVIGPPLEGPNWVAAVVGGCENHRNAVMPIGGRWVVPERWAVDWIQLDEKDRARAGSIEKNESYPQYGKNILAVADGLVEDVRDGMPDIAPGNPPKMISINDAAGNYIMQDIGNGFCALYAHLKPGSLKVKKGDAVKKGQVIALLGNSGNTTGPHLHFHVVHGKSPMGSDGASYAIDSFVTRGTALSNDGLQTELERGEIVSINIASTGPQDRKMPANLSVVDFKR